MSIYERKAMAVSRVVRILQDGAPESRVTARGWVRTRRDSRNGFSFIELNDGSCLKNLQVVVDAGIDGYEESIRQVTTGASVSVDGVLKDSPGKGQRVELHAESLRVIGTADPRPMTRTPCRIPISRMFNRMSPFRM